MNHHIRQNEIEEFIRTGSHMMDVRQIERAIEILNECRKEKYCRKVMEIRINNIVSQLSDGNPVYVSEISTEGGTRTELNVRGVFNLPRRLYWIVSDNLPYTDLRWFIRDGVIDRDRYSYVREGTEACVRPFLALIDAQKSGLMPGDDFCIGSELMTLVSYTCAVRKSPLDRVVLREFIDDIAEEWYAELIADSAAENRIK